MVSQSLRLAYFTFNYASEYIIKVNFPKDSGAAKLKNYYNVTIYKIKDVKKNIIAPNYSLR